MTFKERKYAADHSDLTPLGRVSVILFLILAFNLPNIIIPDILLITDIAPGFWNIFLGNVVAAFIIICGIIVLLATTLFLWAGIKWIFTGYFDASVVLEFIGETLTLIGIWYKIFFGSYKNKWYFLKEWFRPGVIAKEMLEK